MKSDTDPGRSRRPIRWAVAALVAALALVPAALSSAFEQTATTSHQAGASCTAVGTWVHVTTDIGSTTWTIDTGGQAKETGIGNATGTAALSGQVLTITFVASDTVTTGVYSWTLGQDCRSGAGTLSFTGPPSRAGETHASTVTKTVGPSFASPPPTPTKPTGPRIVPRSTRPVPGVVTSYAAPHPGSAIELPYPTTGCTAPTTNALEAAAPAGGECSVDIFLKRKDGTAIHDADADYGTQLELSGANLNKAYKLCLVYAIDAVPTKIGIDAVAFRPFYTCVLTVARILQRAEDLRRRREGTPFEYVSNAAHSCLTRRIRLRGVRTRPVPLKVLCRRNATGTRLTFRAARKGLTIGSLILPSSKLIIGRSDAVGFRPGDRVDVLWKVTPASAPPIA